MSKDNDTFIPPIRPPRNSRYGEPSPELMKRLQQVTPELFAEFLMSKTPLSSAYHVDLLN